MNSDVIKLAANVRLLLMDVDGVLTDGRFYMIPGANGELVETKAFDTQDGMALQWLAWKGIKAGLISGRVSPATVYRATTGKFEFVYQGHLEKIPILEEILSKTGLDRSNIAYIGDDLTDVVVMHRVGLAIATANAVPEVKREAHYVTHAAGGRGAVREAVQLILTGRGFWQDVLDKYEIRGENPQAQGTVAGGTGV